MKTVAKVCPWCGTSFVGYPNKKFCSYECAAEFQDTRKKAKRSGQDYKADVLFMKHKENVRHTKVMFSMVQTLKPIHLSSSCVQWRLVEERRAQ